MSFSTSDEAEENTARQAFWERLNFSFGRRLPLILQSESAECGLACLAMIATFHGFRTDVMSLRRRFSLSLKGATLAHLIDIASLLQFASRPVRLEMESLTDLATPCILHWDLNHFVVLSKVSSDRVDIHDPALGFRRMSFAEVSKHFTGVALELIPTPLFEKKEEKHNIKLAQLMGQVSGLNRSLAQILFLALGLQIIGLVSPFLMQWVVDSVLVTNDRDLLVTLTVGFTLLLLIQVAITWMRSWMVLFMSTHLGLQWNANVFAHMMRLPVSYFEKRHVGDVVSRFSSMQTIQHTLTTSFLEAILDGFMAVSTFGMMIFYNSLLATIVGVAVISYAFLRYSAYRPLREANEEEIVLSSKQQSHLLESIRGVQSIKLFGRENERIARYLNHTVETTNRHIRTQQLTMFYSVANSLVFGASVLAVTYVGANLVMENAFSVGMLFAFTSYSASFTTRISTLIDRWVEIKMLALHGERLADIVLTVPEEGHGDANVQQALDNVPSSTANGSSAAIEVRDVSFRYSDGEPFVLKNCSFRIASGEFVAIAGPSGCGKTTLLKIMLGLLPANSGAVLFEEHSIRRIGLGSYRRQIGTVMQDDQLFAGSISENIHFFDTKADQGFVVRCAQLASIHDEVLAMPMGYHTLIGDMGTALSGGQKQRILLARALYKRPRILLLDEATSHLDLANERTVNQAIDSLNITRIVVAHRPETIAAADRLILLDCGRVSSKPD